MDREKVIKGLEIQLDDLQKYADSDEMLTLTQEQAKEIVALLKKQEEREKAICKEICDFIRGSCSTDTYSDKEYVCDVIQQIFIKGWR